MLMHLNIRHVVAAALLLVTSVGTANTLRAQMTAPPPASGSTSAPQFTILIFEGAAQLADRTGSRQDAYWSAYDDFAAALMRGGVLRGGSALSETTASTVRGRGTADAAVRGARLGGYFVIAAKDIAEAQRWARLAPPQAVMVEVRPHRDNPHMAPAAPR